MATHVGGYVGGIARGARSSDSRSEPRPIASAYFSDAPPSPARDAPARARPAETRDDEPLAESVRYVRSLGFLPREVPRATAPPAASSSAPGVGAFRFPATRAVLYDATPIGDVVHVDAHAHAPIVRLSPELTLALARLAERAPAGVHAARLRGHLRCVHPLYRRGVVEHSAELALDRLVQDENLEGVDRGAAAVSGTTSGAIVSELRAKVLRRVDGEDEASLDARLAAAADAAAVAVDETRRLAAACSRVAPLDPSALWRVDAVVALVPESAPGSAPGSAPESAPHLRVAARLSLPRATFAYARVAPPRVAPTPLAAELIAAQRSKSPADADPGADTGADTGADAPTRTGFLTMDQTRRLVPLEETDPRARELPIVGVWVEGAGSVLHVSAWAACLRFARAENFRDKATQRGGFLLAVYRPGGREGPECFDARLEEPERLDESGSSKSGFDDASAATNSPFAKMELNLRCAPGDTARGRFQTRAAAAVHRAVNRDDDEKGETRGDERDPSDAEVRYRPTSSAWAKSSAKSSVTSWASGHHRAQSPSTGIGSPESAPPATRRSPEYAPFSGFAPRTSYERAVAAAAARAASAAAALAAAGDRSPSRRVDGDGLDGAARDVVREQQRMIAALRRRVDELREEIASASGGGSERGVGEWDDLEAAAEGVRAAKFREGTPPEDGAPVARRRASPSKSPLRKALAFADERRDAKTAEEEETSTRVAAAGVAAAGGAAEEAPEEALEETDAAPEETDAAPEEPDAAPEETDAAPESPDAPPPLSEKEARRLRKQQRKEAKRDKREKKREKRRGGKRDADAEEAPEEAAEEAPEEAAEEAAEEAPEVSGRRFVSERAVSSKPHSRSDARRAASIVARHAAAAAAAATTRAEAREGYPPPPSGVPPDDPEPPRGAPRQPPRSPPKTPYVDSREDVEMHGERAADPLPGASVGYPGEPMLEFATTGTGEASPEASPGAEAENDDDDEADALLRAPLMVDPETMDGETAARAAAAARRDALARYAGAGAVPPAPTEGGETRASREELLRAAVRAGLDPMFPIIDDVGGDEDGLSAEEEDADVLEKYADVRPLDEEEEDEE